MARRRERRRSERALLFRRLTVKDLSTGQRLVLRDISYESFGAESPYPFLLGSEHRFEFRGRHGHPVIGVGLVKRCEKSAFVGDSVHYVVGFVFVYERPKDRALIASYVQVLLYGTAVRAQR